MPCRRPVTSISYPKSVCNMFHSVHIEYRLPSTEWNTQALLWGVYPALPAEYLESVPSTEAAENLSGRKSCWMQLGFALLTEAILMFYWFFDLFFSAPASIYTLSLYLRHEEQPNGEKKQKTAGFGPGPRVSTSGLARTKLQNKSANDDSWRCLILTHLQFYWMINSFPLH